MEEKLEAAFRALGVTVTRAHPYNPEEKHGFISSQREGLNVFRSIPKNAAVVCAEAVWQYSYFLTGGLRFHEGPILCVGNWSAQWPGLVGLLNLTASLTKMNKAYSTLWSVDFTDDFFKTKLAEFIQTGAVRHDLSHVHPVDFSKANDSLLRRANEVVQDIVAKKMIIGIFDEGCMGMYNAIIEDELLNAIHIFKERLSQSALLAEMALVRDDEAAGVKRWLDDKGVRFDFGPNPKTDLTLDQVLSQCKMYIAAMRIAHRFGCDAIGIQYQQGLKDMCPASDLAEALLNNSERPPVFSYDHTEELFPGLPLPHFNEVDEGAAVDCAITNKLWRHLAIDPATTLHDVRYGAEAALILPEQARRFGPTPFVWLLEISGAAPASHFRGGYAGSVCQRQPPVFFPMGGAAFKGIGRVGEIVWSRVYIAEGRLHADIGTGTVVEVSPEEEERRWRDSNPQWPQVNVVLHGCTRDAFMARHKANHIQIVYGEKDLMYIKARTLELLGILVHHCGSHL